MATVLADEQSRSELPCRVAGDAPIKAFETARGIAPAIPTQSSELGVDVQILSDLVMKLAFTVPHLTTDWAAQRLCLAFNVTAELLDELRQDRFLEVLGQTGPFSFRYSISGEGRQRASRLLEICGYVGPAPVSLEAYVGFLDWQLQRLPEVTAQHVEESVADLVLPPQAVEVAGLAAASGRSLFLHGPPGCGKSSVGHLLHRALGGQLWIPHCIAVDNTIVHLFDSQSHQPAPEAVSADEAQNVDARWVCVNRPFVVVGGELTIEDLDLAYMPALGYYEAPLHMKANGGIFLLDDLGCQRTPPVALLKRWIVPLEHQVDHLTLKTGQKMQIPFRQMLIVSTNLDPDTVMEPAILRRMGYRILFDYPTEAMFREIFERYAASRQLPLHEGLIERVLQRYRQQQRPLRSCDPRDLLERVLDIAQYRNQPADLSDEQLDTAWNGYFGQA
jgi:hypothetical protein